MEGAFLSSTPATALATLVSQIDYTLLRLTNTFQLISTVLAIKVTSLTSGFEGRDIWTPLGHLSAC